MVLNHILAIYIVFFGVKSESFMLTKSVKLVSASRSFTSRMLRDNSAYRWGKSPVNSYKPPVSVINGKVGVRERRGRRWLGVGCGEKAGSGWLRSSARVAEITTDCFISAFLMQNVVKEHWLRVQMRKWIQASPRASSFPAPPESFEVKLG